MLRLPETGIRASRTVHNCDLQLFCDWVEGCLLFAGDSRISRTDILDILEEEDIYNDQEFANAWLDNVWNELERRRGLLRHAPTYELEGRAISRKATWEEVPAYAFCVLTPLIQRYPRWRASVAASRLYATQGHLFERISDEALQGAGWRTLRVGWSSDDYGSQRLPEVVTTVARHLGEPEHPNWSTNVSPKGNEAGLDIVFSRAFADGRTGFPIYLAQCASGDDWDTKLHTPVLAIWTRLVDFPLPPQKVFVLPHSLSAEDLRRTTVSVAGVVLDRYRLHDSARPAGWCSSALAEDIRTFVHSVIANLPVYPD